MDIKVRVQNYQSHVDTALHLGGFTVITGQNHVGKTAFLRAINSLITNSKGNGFIRGGEGEAKVTLTFDPKGEDPVEVLWRKESGKSALYSYKGTQHQKVDSVEEVDRFFAIAPIKIHDKVLSLNYMNQHRPLIFTTSSPEFMYRVLVSLTSQTVIENVTSRVRSEARKLSTNLETFTEQKSEYERQQTALSKLPITTLSQRLIEQLKQFAMTAEAFYKAKEVKDKVDFYTESINAVLPVKDRLKPLVHDLGNVLTFAEAAQLASRFSSVVSIQEEAETSKKRVSSVLTTLNSYKILRPEAVQHLIEAVNLKSRLSEAHKVYTTSVSVKEQVAPLFETLSSLPDPEVLGLKARLDTITRAAFALAAQKEAVSSELTSVTSTLSQVKVCPTCGRPFEGEHNHE
jgi:AAA15 family ATPase/GTPase